MRITLALSFLILTAPSYAGFYPSFSPIVGHTVDERESHAEAQCRAICKPYLGWSSRYQCSEKAILDAFRTLHYQVFGCLCECNDS